MARRRQFYDSNVHDQAWARMRHTYEIFDNVVISFSGGKDSLVVLEMAKRIAEEMNIPKVHALFRDEELIPTEVTDFITEKYVGQDWLDLEWWCVPLHSHKHVLGVNQDYIQWDPNREWMRPKPEWALTEKDLGLKEGYVLSQYTCDPVTIRNLKGRIAICTGVRAVESLQRFRAVVNKTGKENYISNGSGSKRASSVRPIFDWVENDVFRFFYDYGIEYCPVYDAQAWMQGCLRVSSALATSSARNFGIYRATSPEMYERSIELFPEMTSQDRYFKEYDRAQVSEQHAQSWKTIEQWVKDNVLDEHQQETALRKLRDARVRARRYPHAYPLKYVFRQMQGQAGKRDIMPLTERQSKGWQ